MRISDWSSDVCSSDLLVPRDPALIGIDDRKRFADVVRAAFGQRRKTLRNALRNVCDEDAMRAAGVDPQARAEQLEVADFVRLANVVAPEAQSCQGIGRFFPRKLAPPPPPEAKHSPKPL